MLSLTVTYLVAILLCIAIHYEVLRVFSVALSSLEVPRLRVLFGVIGTFFAHTLEVIVFAVAYYFLIHGLNVGVFQGSTENTFWDCAYFSITTYTSLGIGDVEPTEALRFLAGFEALLGLMLISWTASFLFLEMQRNWSLGKAKRH